jgi:hypothetical protein
MFKCYRDGDTEASLFAPMPAHSGRCAFFPAQPLLFRKPAGEGSQRDIETNHVSLSVF